MNYKPIVLASLLATSLLSCTKLDEELRGELPADQAEAILRQNADVTALLRATYNSMRGPFQDQTGLWSAGEMTTDAAIGPTRGGDWDDNGVWRVLHAHTWNADHQFLRGTFNGLLQIVFNATNVLSFNPSAAQAAEARFLRAFAMFNVLDGWNQVPFRDPGENLLNAPRVLTGAEATDFLISELTAILPSLPDGPATRSNKNAARALLMKLYLNKGTFADRTAPTFPAADMQQVITQADAIIASNRHTLEDNFFDNFAPNNGTSTELIFANENIQDVESGNVRFHNHATLHYNQNPSGWNGFTTLADFYDKFENTDTRRGVAYPGVTDRTGLRVGFLVGQQFDAAGNPLKDRNGNPLAFTRDVNLIETGNNLEVTGIRVVKYAPDYKNDFTGSRDVPNNDYVLLRYADVLLMKAEAQLRSGNAAGALVIVNQIRANRGATPLATVTLNNMIDERGREMYWEGYRRQDLIRFGKFLDPTSERTARSGNERLLFPIPNQALAVNPNLTQNPGY